MAKQNKCNKKSVIKFAGAFIAWVIGSGFATGQEVFQFFTSFGYWSYGVVLLNLIGFLFLGKGLLVTGYEHKNEKPFNQFKFFCGEKLGIFYSWLIPITLVLIMSVLISGAGAILYEYYGINHYIGSAMMVIMVLYTYMIGFERLIKIISKIGPVIIIFSLLVGIITVFSDFHSFKEVSNYEVLLSKSQSSPHWIVSSVLYLSLNFLSGSIYFTELGISADNRKDAKYGALLGAVALVLTITIMNTAILLNAKNIAGLEIPVLYLAKKISYILGSVFSIVLIAGMFSSCSAMMWSTCNRFIVGGKKGNQIFAVFVSIFIFVLGLFSFSGLMSVFYPLVGYIGLFYIGCVIYKGIRWRGKGLYKNIKEYSVDTGLGERTVVLEQSSAGVKLVAETVRCDTKQIAKASFFLVDDLPILILATENTKINNKKYKLKFQQKVKVIPDELVRNYFEYDLGVISSFVVNHNIAIYLDVSLKGNNVVWIGAGNENNVAQLSIEELEHHSAFKDWVDVCK